MSDIALNTGVNTIEPTKLAPLDTQASEDYTDHLAMLVRNFEMAEDMCREARQLSERDKDYVHNIQYTAEELAVYRKRKQPPLTINYCKRKVETMRGLERRMRSDPKAFPRNPDDEDGANAATDALRFVGDQNNFDDIRSLVYEDMTVSGYGGVDVIVERKPNDDAQIVLNIVPFERLGYDPYSVKADFSDAGYKFIVIWKDRKDALDEWPHAVEGIETTFGTGNGDVYQDTPQWSLWCDSKRTRIRVVQMHYLHGGEWMVATFTRGGFLVEPVISPYKDKDGNSACSLHMRSMYIDRQGNRYGAVRDFISLQDEINKRRSKALHLLNVRQSYGNKKAIQDVMKAKQELAKPDGHIEVNVDAEFGKDFGVLPTGDMASGQMELLQQATGEMQSQGANAALAGTDPRDQSGRAQQLQQQAGQVTLEPGIDGLRMFSREIYEAVWMRIKEYWTDQKWIRVTDDERNIKWVGLNKQVTLGDKLKQLPPDEAQQMSQQMGIQSPFDPQLKQVVEVENDVSGLDVDISIEEGPDLSSLQSEQFETLSGLAKAGLNIPPKAIIQASSLRNKDLILDEMEKGSAPSPQIQKQLADLQQQLQEAQKQLQAANQKDQMQQVQLANKQGEQQLESKRLDIEAMKAQPQAPEQAHPLMGDAEVRNLMAETENKEADAEQTRVETHLLMTTPPPEMKGSVSA